ncbi:MAG: arylsulfatase A-like enzyme [Candidatus Latescibacterota bacterium]|jgi:arylsulfatase A-like enzyme
MNSRPNVLFVFTDQQSAHAMSCAGNPHLHTPNMDALAAEGTRFTQSYCAAPVCGPSRASLTTGRLPHEHGVLVNGMIPDPKIPNVGELFRSAGYDTAWSGRWHLPDNGRDGKVRGFDVLHDPAAPLGLGHHGDEPVTDAAIEFLQQWHQRPFFLGVSLCNPHDICHWIMNPEPPPDNAVLPPLPENFEADPHEAEFIRRCRERDHYGDENTYTTDWDETQWRRYLYAYYRYTEEVDVQVGRLLGALRENGLEENTIVLFTSDHGEGMAAHQWVVKLMLYEEPLRVPLIVRWPEHIAAKRVDDEHLVSGLDVLPTLCDLAGVEHTPVTGMSLKGLIEDPAIPGRPFVVAELHPDTENLRLEGRMLRTQRYKYVRFSEGGNPEMLFDLEADPGERENLVAKEGMRGLLDEHRALMRQWCGQTKDNFTFLL